MRRLNRRLIFAGIGAAVLCFLLMFVVNNNSTGSANDENQPKIGRCHCPSDQQATFPPESSAKQAIVNPNVRRFESCQDTDPKSAVQRAILIYYPHHQSDYFFPEVRWLYRSWKEMLLGQPKNWRTDFVVYTYSFSKDFRSLGCVNRIRTDKEEESMCRLFLYVPIQFRTGKVIENNFQHAFDEAKRLMVSYTRENDPFVGLPNVTDSMTFDGKRSESLYVNLRTYGYIDSINTIYEGYRTFSMYDFVLRTDIDVFIYRHFANYIPTNCSFITGGGGYGTDFNRRKLGRIARDMGFAHANISGMGSTWYGSPYDGYLVANQTLHGMLWLALYEFATPERESKLGTLMWPEWHYGVLLLYGQHLAINHLVARGQTRVIVGHNMLDQSTTDDTVAYVQNGIRLNLHCWHTDLRFSKFYFKANRYNDSELIQYVNDTTARAYAMRMALESKKMTLEELAAYGQKGLGKPQ